MVEELNVLTTCHPYTDWMIIYFCLQTTRHDDTCWWQVIAFNGLLCPELLLC